MNSDSGDLAVTVAVEKVIRSLPGDPRHDGGRVLRVYRRIASGNSRVLVFREAGSTAPGIVAKLVHGDDASRQAATEAARLEALAAHFPGEQGLGVPRVMASLSEPALLIMEEVRGERLDRILSASLRIGGLSRARGPRSAETLCAEAGQWLARLQSIPTSAVVTPRDVGETLRMRLDDALRRLQGRDLSPAAADRIANYFSGHLYTSSSRRAVLHHPDYTPYNMIVTADGLVVLDLGEIDTGHPWEAASFWWACFEWLRHLPWIDHGRVGAYQAAFEDGFGAGALPQPWRQWGMLQRYSYMERDAHRGLRAALRSAWRRLWYRPMRAWLSGDAWVA